MIVIADRAYQRDVRQTTNLFFDGRMCLDLLNQRAIRLCGITRSLEFTEQNEK
jgi:hypothetical protein